MSKELRLRLAQISSELAKDKRRTADKLIVDEIIAKVNLRVAQGGGVIGLPDLGTGFGPKSATGEPSGPTSGSPAPGTPPGIPGAGSPSSPTIPSGPNAMDVVSLDHRQNADSFLKEVESEDGDDEAVLIRQYLAWGLAKNIPKAQILQHAQESKQSPEFIQKLHQYLDYVMPMDGVSFKPQDNFQYNGPGAAATTKKLNTLTP